MVSSDEKAVASKEDTFDLLEMRLGRVVSAEIEPSAPKKAYKLVVDFGKFGRKTSIGRFTHHSPEDVVGKLVVGVLNFPVRTIGNVISEVLILGTQYPKADSGEATFLTPIADSRIGGKIF